MSGLRTTSLWLAFADLAKKMHDAEGNPMRQRKLLLAPQKGKWEGVHLGVMISTILLNATQTAADAENKAAEARPAASPARVAVDPTLCPVFAPDNDAATHCTHCNGTPADHGATGTEPTPPAAGSESTPQPEAPAGSAIGDASAGSSEAPLLDADGERVGTVINPTWPCPGACGGHPISTSSSIEGADGTRRCGTCHRRRAMGLAASEITPRTAFRCFQCGSGGFCRDVSKLGVCASPECGGKPYDVWTIGSPTGKQQKCIEDLPELLKKKARKAKETKDGLAKACDLCNGPILPGEPQRVHKSRRAHDACVLKHEGANVDTAKGILDQVPLEDDSTDEDWDH